MQVRALFLILIGCHLEMTRMSVSCLIPGQFTAINLSDLGFWVPTVKSFDIFLPAMALHPSIPPPNPQPHPTHSSLRPTSSRVLLAAMAWLRHCGQYLRDGKEQGCDGGHGAIKDANLQWKQNQQLTVNAFNEINAITDFNEINAVTAFNEFNAVKAFNVFNAFNAFNEQLMQN